MASVEGTTTPQRVLALRLESAVVCSGIVGTLMPTAVLAASPILEAVELLGRLSNGSLWVATLMLPTRGHSEPG